MNRSSTSSVISTLALLSILLSSCASTPTSSTSSLQPAQPAPAPNAALASPPSTVNTAPLQTNPAPQIAPDPRNLPALVAESEEMKDARTPHSATFSKGAGKGFVTVISADPLHYTEPRMGNRLNVIQPMFERDKDGYEIQHHTLRVRAGSDRASIAASANATTLNWQSLELGVASDTGTPYTTLAKAGPVTPQKSDDGRTLNYRWKDDDGMGIVEQITTDADGVEQQLVFAKAPAQVGDWLELHATLRLLPNHGLYADGKLQTAAFRTSGVLEVRGKAGGDGILIAPVIAYEQKNPQQQMAGEYAIEPYLKDVWLVKVRTPLSWWRAVGRNYPVILDPAMKVLRTVGNDTAGMAWVVNGYPASGSFPPYPAHPKSESANMHFDRMILGSWWHPTDANNTTRTFGYLQFNNIPWLLASKAYSITKVTLNVTPSSTWMPYYEFDEGDFPDWEWEKIQKDATLFDLTHCPDACNGFSLHTQPAGFNWGNHPTGPAIGTKGLTAPAPKKESSTKTTAWDVTAQLRKWADKAPRPNYGPMFGLTFNTACKKVSFYDDNGGAVPQCIQVGIRPSDVQLVIEYDPMPLSVGQQILNTPGIPSFVKDTFDNGSTPHEYALNNGSGTVWRAVAVRPNHAVTNALPGRAGLRLWSYTGTPAPIATDDINANEIDDTNFVLIDDHNANSGITGQTLRAQVMNSIPETPNGNDFPSDGDRNYRVHYAQALAWNINYGTRVTMFVNMQSNTLIDLREFELAQGDAFQIDIVVPPTGTTPIGDVRPVLVAPTHDAVGVQREEAMRSGDGSNSGMWLSEQLNVTTKDDNSKIFAKTIKEVAVGGQWALALVNHARPVIEHVPSTVGGGPGNIAMQVAILRCPYGTIPTKRWGCQPVLIPNGGTDTRSALGYTIYNEGGFNAIITGGWCTRNEGNGAPLIGPANSTRWFVVGQGRLCFDNTRLYTSDDSGVFVAYETAILADGRKHGAGPFFSYGSTDFYPLPDDQPTGIVEQRAAPAGQVLPVADTRRTLAPFNPHWKPQTTRTQDYVNLPDMKHYGHDTVSVNVVIDAASGPVSTTWQVPWTMHPYNGPTLKYIFDQNTNQQAAYGVPSSLASAALRLLGAAQGELNTLDTHSNDDGPVAYQFREASARITQPQELGSASKDVQAIALPPGKPHLLPAQPPPNEASTTCGAGTSCLDLYAMDYGWGAPPKLWEFPDVHVANQAGTVIMAYKDKVDVFSADHPNSNSGLLSALADDEDSFSFDSFSAGVWLKQERCDEGGPVVTVIRGEGSIAMPMIGDDGSDPGGAHISMKFKLCETQLRQALLALDLGNFYFPVGSTGMGINYVAGEIRVNATYSTISFTLGFQTMDGQTLTNGLGTVLVDTRGLFDLQASAQIIKVIDASLHLQVAWNPLDILLEAQASCCGNLIEGYLRLHGWVGQGWQNKYYWLPDNNDFHFAGEIEAALRIKEDSISDDLSLPPFDIEFGIRVAFGEFCANDNCTQYVAGLSVSISVVGFDIGVFISDDGAELILGTDDHVLVDEFGGNAQAMQMQAAPEALAPSLAPEDIQATQVFTLVWQPGLLQPFLKKSHIKTPVDDWPSKSAAQQGCTGLNTSIITCPFNVTSKAGRALFTAQWQNGVLDVALIKPDNTVVTSSNAVANAISLTTDSRFVAFAANAPAPGQWKVRLTGVNQNLPPATKSNYRLLFVTDPAKPTLSWVNPTTPNIAPNVGGIVPIQWSAVRAGLALTPATKIDLFYTPVLSKPITPTVMGGDSIMLATRQSATAGAFNWDTRGVLPGAYAVGARIDDTRHGNGVQVFWAPGTVLVPNDVTPPPVPNVLGTTQLHDAVVVAWLPDKTTPDLAGYLVEYKIPDWNKAAPQLPRVRRVLPRNYDADGDKAIVERVRLGGLNDGTPFEYCVRAFDLSGNKSNPNCQSGNLKPTGTLSAPRRPSTDVQQVVINFGNTSIGRVTGISVKWVTPTEGNPAGYLLSYHPVGCVIDPGDHLADQGASAINVGNVLTYTLTGLQVGQRYRFGVRAYSAAWYISAPAYTTRLYASTVDFGNDGMSDEWEALYALTDASADKDSDGLTNLQEYERGTFPNQADSDGDGFDDGEEVDFESDPCAVGSQPPYHGRPKLVLVGSLVMKLKQAINGASAFETLNILNFGAGNLNWRVSADVPWIAFDQGSGQGDGSVRVMAKTAGLAPGKYVGKVTVNSSGAGANANAPSAYAESASVEVVLDVLPQQASVVLLPLVRK